MAAAEARYGSAGSPGISAETGRRLERFLDELYRWNQRINLTAVAPEDAWQRHVAESLGLLDAAPVGQGARVVDVGSGAGIPGIPLALARPDLRLTLLEADRRRAGFLTHVAGLLGLDTLTVSARRAEEAGRDPAMRESFDVAVTRAAAPGPVLCELALPLVRLGGSLVALVGDPAAEAAACAAAAAVCGGSVPRTAGTGLLIVAKERATPARYPRPAGIPARRPLS